MKKKFLGLMLLLFISCAVSSTIVSADAQPITQNQTVKVNKKIKLYKTLGVSKDTMQNYTISSSKTKVATVSANGVVTGLKKGSATISVKSKSTGETYAQINVKVKNRYSKNSLRLMSSIIYSEAGAECFAGKKAVAIVIMNRVKSSSFPNTISGVIYQPYQFGPVNNGSLSKSLSLYDAGKLNKACIKAAKLVLNGDRTVNYRGQSINMSGYLFFSGYVSGAKLTIQNHMFK